MKVSFSSQPSTVTVMVPLSYQASTSAKSGLRSIFVGLLLMNRSISTACACSSAKTKCGVVRLTTIKKLIKVNKCFIFEIGFEYHKII